MQEDPITFDGGLSNLSDDVGNNPTNATDPSGLELKIGDKEAPADISDKIKAVIKTKAASFPEDYEAIVDEIVNGMKKSSRKFEYKEVNQLLFDVIGRLQIVKAARDFAAAKLRWSPDKLAEFPDSNNWKNQERQGMTLDSMEASKIRKGFDEIYAAGKLKEDARPGFDCASAGYVAYCRAIQMTIATMVTIQKDQDSALRKVFPGDSLLVRGGKSTDFKPEGLVTNDKETNDVLIPGDAVYFENPGFTKMAYRGENAIFLGKGEYLAHPWGIVKMDKILDELKENSNKPKDIKRQDAISTPRFYRINW
jgi:hypothetical protein